MAATTQTVNILPPTLTLRGPRIILRTHEVQDYPVIRDFLSDPTTMTYLPGLLKEWTLEEVTERQESRVADQKKGLGLPLSVILPGDEETLIGTSGFRTLDLVKRCAEFGIILRTGFHGKGYAQEIMLVLFTYGFEDLGLEKIEIVTSQRNIPMRRCLERLSIREIGVMQWDDPGPMGDEVAFGYAVLLSDWNDLKLRLRGKIEGR
ncbi:uncharacterized protein SPPG_03560 [Spizellomyces punctatus DAOM BR117]|uniref:N-acetyltransferase domain-containing protein n=1 Tax=Spizellomyces punctatus (strain DAOM BR117) TaxID=645134 RepID=A0A0L0HLT1_SPIPD|nr:uncharacterized protein SPPG_03560 [Spizellomyces punctatus DAOM BR117]KND01769.1 hypothetical protein SPPG_03560 [Spizellomyces punctatus DAOM BR117]|eukprot:XP_016609808.1 hypothetical protein SPPG_03560 [Spizellomyces punctatus DAOM BR117]